jgi:hypothetical protein
MWQRQCHVAGRHCHVAGGNVMWPEDHVMWPEDKSHVAGSQRQVIRRQEHVSGCDVAQGRRVQISRRQGVGQEDDTT